VPAPKPRRTFLDGVAALVAGAGDVDADVIVGKGRGAR
jgi:hypothetical protein